MIDTPRLLALSLLLAGSPALARAPDTGGSPRPFRTPPAEAQAACAQSALGATCSFTYRERAHTGVCRRGPEGQGPIACAPHRGPEQGPGRGGGGEDGGGQDRAPPPAQR